MLTKTNSCHAEIILLFQLLLQTHKKLFFVLDFLSIVSLNHYRFNQLRSKIADLLLLLLYHKKF